MIRRIANGDPALDLIFADEGRNSCRRAWFALEEVVGTAHQGSTRFSTNTFNAFPAGEIRDLSNANPVHPSIVQLDGILGFISDEHGVAGDGVFSRAGGLAAACVCEPQAWRPRPVLCGLPIWPLTRAARERLVVACCTGDLKPCKNVLVVRRGWDAAGSHRFWEFKGPRPPPGLRQEGSRTRV